MGKAAVTGFRGATQSRLWSHRGNGGGMSAQEIGRNTGSPSGGCVTQPDAREGQAGPYGVSERSIVPLRPANAGGGKGPQFKANVRSSREPGDWRESNTSTKGSEAAGDVACQSEGNARRNTARKEPANVTWHRKVDGRFQISGCRLQET